MTTVPDSCKVNYNENIDHVVQEYYDRVGIALYQNVGSNKYRSTVEAMRGIDIVRNTIYMPDLESNGFTFMTRPKLNMTTMSIRSDRILAMLDTELVDTIQTAIRVLLDTKFKLSYPGLSLNANPFIDDLNPFIPIFTNRLTSLSGWPDPIVDIETTTGGFFSESMTYPKGYDQLTKNYDLTANFSDVQGSILLMLFMIWSRYIALVTRGVVVAYPEDIDARRMGFTSSVYRFVMDPSRRYITKWAKATGCFPRSVPLGAYFNFDAGSHTIDASTNVSIPITVAGKVEYMDPIILQEFNMVSHRRNPSLKAFADGNSSSFAKASPYERTILNFRCQPYINTTDGSNELMWLYDSSDGNISRLRQSAKIDQYNTFSLPPTKPTPPPNIVA